MRPFRPPRIVLTFARPAGHGEGFQREELCSVPPPCASEPLGDATNGDRRHVFNWRLHPTGLPLSSIAWPRSRSDGVSRETLDIHFARQPMFHVKHRSDADDRGMEEAIERGQGRSSSQPSFAARNRASSGDARLSDPVASRDNPRCTYVDVLLPAIEPTRPSRPRRRSQGGTLPSVAAHLSVIERRPTRPTVPLASLDSPCPAAPTLTRAQDDRCGSLVVRSCFNLRVGRAG